MEKCVLAVRDDELSMGDDKDASLEAAEGWGTCGRTVQCILTGTINSNSIKKNKNKNTKKNTT